MKPISFRLYLYSETWRTKLTYDTWTCEQETQDCKYILLPWGFFFQLLLPKMVCWECFNATTNIKYISHINNTVERTALNICFLWNLPLPTLVGMSTTQNIFPNLLLKHISGTNTISNTALTSIIEAQKDLMTLKTWTKWEKKHFLSPL